MILIPLDGSPRAEQALPVARVLAERSGAALCLVHVRNPTHPIYVEGLPVIDDAFRPQHDLHERTYLEGVRANLRAEPGIDVRVDRLEGPIAPTIAAHASAIGSDLIVMTTHGRGGFERLWLGSVADALVRLSSVPILLRTPPGDGGAEAEGFTCERILVPLDGSPLAEQILPAAESLARLMGARFHLLHVREASDLPEPEARSTDRMHDYLRQLAATLEQQGFQVEHHLVTAEHPARAILDMAGKLDADLIALATHGRGGVQRLLLGSVSDKVLRSSSKPILLYRPE